MALGREAKEVDMSYSQHIRQAKKGDVSCANCAYTKVPFPLALYQRHERQSRSFVSDRERSDVRFCRSKGLTRR